LGPQDLDDRVHDTFLIVVQAISKGDLREPERLMGFVRTVVRRLVDNRRPSHHGAPPDLEAERKMLVATTAGPATTL
jgi:DNA-directed RNA polymerase specialized sigma24 family protein